MISISFPDMQRKMSWWQRILVAAFWLGLWAVLAGALNQALLLPSPLQVFLRITELAVSAQFWKTIGVTILRIMTGILCAIVFGILLAGLTTRFALMDYLFTPLLTVIQSTPVASFILLVLIWIGRNWVPAVISGMMVLPIIWKNLCTGLAEINPQYLQLAKVHKFSKATQLRRIVIPSVMPYFLSAMQISIGIGWKSGVAAEVLTVPVFAIGKMIFESKLYMETTDLFAWTIVVILLSLLFEKGAAALLRRALAGLHCQRCES